MFKSWLKLTFIFSREFLISNWMMMKAVVLPHKFEGAFIEFKLDLKSPKSIAWISQMITLTPGTTTVDYNSDSKTLMIYAFYGAEPEKVVSEIRRNFETHLKAIWG